MDKRNVNEWNEQEYENFVREHSTLFYAFVRQYLKDTSVGQDIVQDVLFNLWCKRRKMQHVADAKKYLFVMIKNRAFNYLKREKKIIYVDDILLNEYDETDSINYTETFHRLMQEIKMLDNGSKKIMEMTLAGKRNEKISNELGMTLDGVKSKKKRIMLKLKAKLSGKPTKKDPKKTV